MNHDSVWHHVSSHRLATSACRKQMHGQRGATAARLYLMGPPHKLLRHTQRLQRSCLMAGRAGRRTS